jgi:hypothetical protein
MTFIVNCDVKVAMAWPLYLEAEEVQEGIMLQNAI